MPSRDLGVPVPVLREALKQRVAESSLRVVAEEVGLSWKGIDKIIAGSNPQAATIKKLTEWYLRQSRSQSKEPSASSAQAALSILLWHLPLGRHADAEERILRALRAVGEMDQVPEPEWMASRGEV
jgi:anti-sigma factor ChrR (cupin superfamily)